MTEKKTYFQLTNWGKRRQLGQLNWPYEAAHNRVKALKGKATQYECEHCEADAKDWAYDRNDPNSKIAKSKRGKEIRYSDDPNHYLALCKPCHRKLDSHEGVQPTFQDK